MQASTGHPDPEDLTAYVDGEASDEVKAHIAACLTCAERVATDAMLQSELRGTLYRFDCPEAHTLGEYQIDALDATRRTLVAAHAAECDECQAELQVLRAYLAAPTLVPESLIERSRRVVASVFRPMPGLAYGGLRGTAETANRVFEAQDVTVTVGPGHGRGTLIGLVVVAAAPPDAVTDREVRLLPTDGPALTSTLDDLGNFEFGHLASGLYALEVDLADDLVVVVEELRVH
jgi:anti-sigma factor RsiW